MAIDQEQELTLCLQRLTKFHMCLKIKMSFGDSENHL